MRVLVGISGASGSIYAERLIAELASRIPRVYVIFTKTGQQVCRHELTISDERFSLLRLLKQEQNPDHVIRVFSDEDLFAPVASGSSVPTHMVVLPCSMGCLARISCGISSGLLERAADVMLKQKRPLIVCPRETPLNTIHLRNMTSLSEMGVHIVPAMPAFYQKPSGISDLVDFMVGRILEILNLDHQLYRPWNPRMR
ncbi:MAG: UbiX family flavin prenyltransferase [Deltaproteobacteria bacterium]|nr:UbiX family flavin prenyltransferase [Deltaproteobacteria bacterium]